MGNCDGHKRLGKTLRKPFRSNSASNSIVGALDVIVIDRIQHPTEN